MFVSNCFGQIPLSPKDLKPNEIKDIKQICTPTPEPCNLVMNGDFEQNIELPHHYSESYKACGWENSHYSTDYYHINASQQVIIPCNDSGYQDIAATGKGYAGFGIWTYNGLPNFFGSEILKTQLETSLLPNTTYQISFDISRADTFNEKATRVQAYLSTTNIPVPSGTTLPIANPSMLFTSPTYITDANGWQTINFTFTTTTGGEQYLYLGNLNYTELANTNVFITNVAAQNPLATACNPSAQYISNGAYYYLDNVKINTTEAPIFDLPTAICIDTTPPILPTTSANGITGIWSPNVIDNTATGVYTFTPTVAGGCSENLTMTITVVQDCNIQISTKLAAFHFIYNFNGNSQTSIGNIYDLASGVGAGYPCTIGGLQCNENNVYVASSIPPLAAGITISPDGRITILGNLYPYFHQRVDLQICPTATPGTNCITVILDVIIQ